MPRSCRLACQCASRDPAPRRRGTCRPPHCGRRRKAGRLRGRRGADVCRRDRIGPSPEVPASKRHSPRRSRTGTSGAASVVEVALAASVQLEPAVLAVEVVLTALVQLEPAVSVVEVAQAASVVELALAALEPAVSAVEVEQAASVVEVAPAALVQAAKAGLAKVPAAAFVPIDAARGQTATSPTGRSEGV